ncbi:MAG: exopolysaccharide biosynthesis polyprenyl glycosylphosphotransferase [Clostridia bacterium]|nr:exopolysaccharide biosynthesis polyprenyl glycosylphosphotransferase [Clostridia bacterium]
MNHAEYSSTSKLLAVKLVHFALNIALFYIAFLLFRYEGLPQAKEAGFRYNYYVTAGYGVLLLLFARTYNSYLYGYSRVWSLISAQFLTQLISVAIVYVIVCVSWNHLRNPLAFVCMLAGDLLLDIVWSYLGTLYYTKLNPARSTILVYRNSLDRKRFGSITGKPAERMYKITRELKYDGSFDDLRPQLDAYEAVFVAGVNSVCRNGILKYCKERGIPGFFLPHIGDVIMQEAKHIQSFDSPVLFVNRKTLTPEYALAKRLFDIIASALGLIVASPVMLLTALAIKLYDKGPVIYRQVRLTKGAREFEMLKFRSMRVDAEKDGVARLSSGDSDRRITPVGRLARRLRIDELPQLFNILKGDMSVVGPRPERPEIAEQYYKTMPDFKLRLQVKAGLTGYAQIYGKYNTDPYEKLEFDLLYINRMSALTDLRLTFATVGLLFTKSSTEGIEEGHVTALNPEKDIEEDDK